MLTHAQFIAALERRYDYYSARVVAREALAAASLQEQAGYDGAQLASLAAVLDTMGERVATIAAQLREAAGPHAAAPVEPAAPAPSEVAATIIEEVALVAPAEPVSAPDEPIDTVVSEGESSGEADTAEIHEETDTEGAGGGKGHRGKKKR